MRSARCIAGKKTDVREYPNYDANTYGIKSNKDPRHTGGEESRTQESAVPTRRISRTAHPIVRIDVIASGELAKPVGNRWDSETNIKHNHPPGNQSGVEATIARSYPRQIPVPCAHIGRRVEIQKADPPRAIANIEKKRRARKRNRSPMAGAMKAVRMYREAVDRDLMQAEAIWDRLDDPYRSDGDDPIRGCSKRAVDCARKGKEFIEIAKVFGTSKAAQILRSDTRRKGGTRIQRNDAPAEFDRAVYNSTRLRSTQCATCTGEWSTA